MYENLTYIYTLDIEVVQEKIEEVQVEEIIEFVLPPIEYDIDDELMREFLCSNTNMTFISNPFD